MLKYFLLALLIIPVSLQADDLDTGLAKLSGDLSAAISKSGSKKISVIDFTDLEGHDSDFGRFLAEQLSVALVNSSKDFAVLDRANLKSILSEHKLTASGLVNPDNAKKLGQFAGVDAIVLGSITRFGDSLFITAKAISTETTQVLAAVKITIPRTKDIDTMLSPEKPTEDTTVAAPESDENTASPAPTKDFSAPSSTNDFQNISVDLISFRIANFNGASGVLALVKVRNRSSTVPLKIGLDSAWGSPETTSTYLINDQGDTLQLYSVDGIDIPQSYFSMGGAKDLFNGLRYIQSKYDEGGQWRDAFNERLTQMTDIGAGQSALVTLHFSARHSVGSNFRMQSEIIVAEMTGTNQARLSLNSLIIPDIRPK